MIGGDIGKKFSFSQCVRAVKDNKETFVRYFKGEKVEGLDENADKIDGEPVVKYVFFLIIQLVLFFAYLYFLIIRWKHIPTWAVVITLLCARNAPILSLIIVLAVTSSKVGNKKVTEFEMQDMTASPEVAFSGYGSRARW